MFSGASSGDKVSEMSVPLAQLYELVPCHCLRGRQPRRVQPRRTDAGALEDLDGVRLLILLVRDIARMASLRPCNTGPAEIKLKRRPVDMRKNRPACT